MVEKALLISLFVVVWLFSCVFINFVGLPDDFYKLKTSYEIFTQPNDLVESCYEISQVFEGPVN